MGATAHCGTPVARRHRRTGAHRHAAPRVLLGVTAPGRVTLVRSALCSLRVLHNSGAALYGRAAELDEIRRLLTREHVRLLTLTGPGGTGKTRLAEAVAAEDLALPWSSITFVDLSAVAEASGVPAAIADALGIQEGGGAPLLTLVRDVIGPSGALLVLDNFERVIEAAGFVAQLLIETPQLACVVTSREPLHLRSEHVYQVQPLLLPDPGVTDLKAIASAPSVALFVDRGQARWHEFRLTPENAQVIVEICRRLDGLPLALELAAAQVGILSPEAVLARLEAAEPFILEGARDVPARHRSLSTAIRWSYDLLSASEQVAFRGCGVFNGSFAPAALAAVIAAPTADAALAMAARLADKNLVRVADPGLPEPRFRLLETIRSFAVDLLVEYGELTNVRRKHAAYFLELVEVAEQALIGQAMAATLDRLDGEYDNFRSVLTWSLESGELDVGLRLTGALNRFWMMRGHLSDARRWLERALPRSCSAAPEVRAKALNTAGVLAGLQGDSGAAEPYFRESYGLWETLGNPTRMAAAMGNLGLVAQDQEDTDRALTCFMQAEALYGAGGDRRGIAVSMGSRAHLARQQGHTAEAMSLFERTLAIFREVGDPRGMANSLANLGHAMVAFGQPDAAVDYLIESLELRQALGHTLAVAECLEGLAAAAAAKGQGRRGARLLGAADALREITGARLAHAERREYDAISRAIQDIVTHGEFTIEHAVGREYTLEEALDYAMRRGVSDDALSTARVRSSTALTQREHEIAVLVSRGMTNGEIADSLALSRRTIGTHLEHVFAKLDIQSRAELAAWIALETGRADNA